MSYWVAEEDARLEGVNRLTFRKGELVITDPDAVIGWNEEASLWMITIHGVRVLTDRDIISVGKRRHVRVCR